MQRAVVSVADVATHIVITRGQRVLLDAQLARLYGVETKRLNEQVKRNQKRFPADFAFVLTTQEFTHLKPQIAASSWGGRRKLPTVFTEHGALMAASVLNSTLAVQMSVYVVRAFVQQRALLGAHQTLAEKLAELEQRVAAQDESLDEVIEAIRTLMAKPATPAGRPIGFTADLQLAEH
jgi:hypothetical protein